MCVNTCRTSPGTGVQAHRRRQLGSLRRIEAIGPGGRRAARSCRRAGLPAAAAGTGRHRPHAPAGTPWRTVAAAPCARPCAGSSPGHRAVRRGTRAATGRRGRPVAVACIPARPAPSAPARNRPTAAWSRVRPPARAAAGRAAGRGVCDRMHPGEHPLDIGVDRNRSRTAGDRRDRGRRVGADARQCEQERASVSGSCRRDAPRRPARRRAGRGHADSSRGPARRAARRRAKPRPGFARVGKRSRNGSNRPRTVATVVCCSISSLTSTRQGSGRTPGARARAGRAARRRTRPAARSQDRAGGASAGDEVAVMIALAALGEDRDGDQARCRRTRVRGKGGAATPAVRWPACSAPFSTRPRGDAASPRRACSPTGRASSARCWRGAASRCGSTIRPASAQAGTLVLQTGGGDRDRAAAWRAPADRADQHLFRLSCRPAAPAAADAAAAGQRTTAAASAGRCGRRTRRPCAAGVAGIADGGLRRGACSRSAVPWRARARDADRPRRLAAPDRHPIATVARPGGR